MFENFLQFNGKDVLGNIVKFTIDDLPYRLTLTDIILRKRPMSSPIMISSIGLLVKDNIYTGDLVYYEDSGSVVKGYVKSIWTKDEGYNYFIVPIEDAKVSLPFNSVKIRKATGIKYRLMKSSINFRCNVFHIKEYDDIWYDEQMISHSRNEEPDLSFNNFYNEV